VAGEQVADPVTGAQVVIVVFAQAELARPLLASIDPGMLVLPEGS